MTRVKKRGGAGKKGKETLAGQTPLVWKLPTWPVMHECAHRHLMLSSAVINWHIKCLAFRGAEVNFRGRVCVWNQNNVFISEETRGRREWRTLNESERSMRALKLHTEFDLQSWSYFVKLTLQDINTTQKEANTGRDCSRRRNVVQGWSYEAFSQNLQKVGFEVVKCDKFSSLELAISELRR